MYSVPALSPGREGPVRAGGVPVWREEQDRAPGSLATGGDPTPSPGKGKDAGNVGSKDGGALYQGPGVRVGGPQEGEERHTQEHAARPPGLARGTRVHSSPGGAGRGGAGPGRITA